MAKACREAAGLLLAPITGNASFFVFMYVLGWLCVIFTESPDGVPPSYRYAPLELFVDLYVLCALLCLVPRRMRCVPRVLLAVAFYAVSIADLYCFERFNTSLSPTMLLLVGETNYDEASQFFSSYVGWEVLASHVGWLLALAFLHLGAGIVGIVMRRARHLPRVNEEIAARCSCLCRFPSAIAVSALLIWGIAATLPNKSALFKLFSAGDLGKVERAFLDENKAELYLPVYRLAFSVYANRLASGQLVKLTESVGSSRVDSCSFRSPDIVLVIGESHNRHHSQLYGYEKAVSPRQKARADEGRLVVFSDVVSPWNLTSFVFKNMFSLQVIGDAAGWSDYPLFPEVFRAAGYGVTFVTNQFVADAAESICNFSGGFFMTDRELSSRLFDVRNSNIHEFDEGLLAEYDTLRRPSAKGNLTIFHLKGQHAEYRRKYPRDRKVFKPTDYKHRNVNNHARWVLADYDNATLYNDSILDAVIKRFENREAVVVYLSDHGESCFGFDRDKFGRTHSDRPSYETAYEEYEVPFWIWCSEKYEAAHPDVMSEIREAADKPFMTDRLPHLLIYLGGISCPSYRPDCNPLSAEYNAGNPRILKNTTDYDKLRNDYGK